MGLLGARRWQEDLEGVFEDVAALKMIADHKRFYLRDGHRMTHAEAFGYVHQAVACAERVVVKNARNLSMEGLAALFDLLAQRQVSLISHSELSERQCIEAGDMFEGSCKAIRHAGTIFNRTGLDAGELRVRLGLADKQAVVEVASELSGADLEKAGERGGVIVVSGDCDDCKLQAWYDRVGSYLGRVKLSVVKLPKVDDANLKGLTEMVLWRTNLLLDPRVCLVMGGASGVRLSREVQPLAEGELCLDFAFDHSYLKDDRASFNAAQTILFSHVDQPNCLMQIGLPCFGEGLGGQVMRFDGQLIRLSEENNLVDPAAVFLGEVVKLRGGL